MGLEVACPKPINLHIRLRAKACGDEIVNVRSAGVMARESCSKAARDYNAFHHVAKPDSLKAL